VKLLLALLLALAPAACDSVACSKCPPGTRGENPGEFCSRCIPDDGGVRDGGPG
jgi:hypothetical protein